MLLKKNIFLYSSMTNFRMESINQSNFQTGNSNSEDNFPEHLLKSKPVEPLPEQCCGNGCKLCIFDLYQQELEIWKKECLKYMNNSSEEDKNSENKPIILQDEYTKYKLTSIESDIKSCNIYRFSIPGNNSLNLKLGQHLILRGKVNDNYVSRPYTPVSPSNTKGYFDVLIKIYENGLLSGYIAKLKQGDEAEWRGAFGNFTYKPNSFKKLVLIAAGTGITPMIPIIQCIIENAEDETFLRLLFSCRTYDEINLKDRLNHYKSFWNFTARYFLSEETDNEKKKYGDEIFYGKIDKNLLSEEISPEDECQVLVCGTPAFNKDVESWLKHILNKNCGYFIFQ